MSIERYAGPIFLVSLFPVQYRRTALVCRLTLLILLGGPIALVASILMMGDRIMISAIDVLPEWLTNTIAFALILLSCLLHEVGHGLAAAAFGGRTVEIGMLLLLIFPVGMYLSYEGAPNASRFAKYAVAVAGVSTNAFCTLAYVLLVGHAGPLDQALLVAAIGNLFLIAANLMPGSLLDGGSILESATGITHIYRKALRFLISGRERRRVFRRGPVRGVATVGAYLLAGVGQLGMIAVLVWSVIGIFVI